MHDQPTEERHPAEDASIPGTPSPVPQNARPVHVPVGANRTRLGVLARAWRWLLPLVAALAAATVAFTYGNTRSPHVAQKLIAIGGAAAFLLFALAGTLALADQIRRVTRSRLGPAHANVLRLIVVLAGGFTSLSVALSLLSIPIGQLVLGGALTGVVFGIAAQQTLANLFAGIVLLAARPFRVGDRVQFRSGALGGNIEGLVVEIGLAYVYVNAAEGLLAIPSSQALNAVVGPPTGQVDPAGQSSVRDSAH